MVALNHPAGSSLDIISHTRSSLVLWSTIILLAGPVVPQGSPSCMGQFKWVSNFFSRKRSLLSSVSGDSDEQQFEPKPMQYHKAFVGAMLQFFYRSALASVLHLFHTLTNIFFEDLTIAPANGGQLYNGSSPGPSGTPCMCNTVAYTTYSACAYCQLNGSGIVGRVQRFDLCLSITNPIL